MTERVEIGDAVLYQGDCLEIMPTLEAGSVGLWTRYDDGSLDYCPILDTSEVWDGLWLC